MKYLKLVLIGTTIAVILFGGYYLARFVFRPARYVRVGEWIWHSEDHPDWAIKALSSCDSAPFIFPTDGFIGFLWGDSFRIGHRHQGLDIFSGTDSGITPVYSAYDGYLTRLPDWKASIIIRIPHDPLNPDQQIWTYYTHMAGEAGNSYIVDQFPPGSNEVFIKAGTLLGYQGNYSGTPGNPTGIHLHFSIVKDDGKGDFLNELEIRNTLDPSLYFNLDLNGKTNQDAIPICRSENK